MCLAESAITANMDSTSCSPCTLMAAAPVTAIPVGTYRQILPVTRTQVNASARQT
ncbi:hypothetical protein COCON_G00012370 [Conger conger]|uniref:Uncharacterized protein n=1 Tax=Conger conger TaxID=82655 RepID=A0A9Q1E2W0_CONCO|nr:hypothetical protein COCON_G00012370 [Conger conger]